MDAMEFNLNGSSLVSNRSLVWYMEKKIQPPQTATRNMAFATLSFHRSIQYPAVQATMVMAIAAMVVSLVGNWIMVVRSSNTELASFSAFQGK